MFISNYEAPTLQQVSVQVFGEHGSKKINRILFMSWESSMMDNFAGSGVDKKQVCKTIITPRWLSSLIKVWTKYCEHNKEWKNKETL